MGGARLLLQKTRSCDTDELVVDCKIFREDNLDETLAANWPIKTDVYSKDRILANSTVIVEGKGYVAKSIGLCNSTQGESCWFANRIAKLISGYNYETVLVTWLDWILKTADLESLRWGAVSPAV